MDKVTVSRAAIALVGRVLLERLAHQEDRRSHHLVLTEAGRTLHATTAPKALDIERRIFAHVEHEEVERFETMLGRIDRIACDTAPEEEQRKAGETKDRGSPCAYGSRSTEPQAIRPVAVDS